LAMPTCLTRTHICFVAQESGMLLTGPLDQAAGVGVSMPLLHTIMLSIFPTDKRGAAMGTSGIVIGLASALGPTLSGWII
ncbi:MFS transporter, partial [Enterococcus faecalis]|uniref:MFS transporter n=1 Tax=Enterococcus faecalis TaxID=1351 RepID=UPI003D6A5E5F